MDIYKILSSKPHNPHYLMRYYKFIQYCDKENKSLNEDVYKENHHICPKAEDLFPEYKNLNQHSWNSIHLTSRQHILAHVILWKAYGGSQSTAVYYMIHVQNSNYSDISKRKIPTSVGIRYAAKAKEAFALSKRNKATYKDSEGNKYFLPTDSPLIQELNLVGNVSGRVHSEETREQMKATKLPNKRGKLYKLDKVISLKIDSDEYQEYISDGWSDVKSEEDYEYCKQNGNELISKFWLGKSRYATPDGVYHGAYHYSDPIIKQLGLIQYRSAAQIAQNASRTLLATEARTGSNIYNNGEREEFLHEPAEGWVLGRLPRSEEWETTRSNAVKDAVCGSNTYTNNEVNMFVKPGDIIPEGFYPGMKHRDNITYYYINGDKNDVLEFLGKHKIPDITIWNKVKTHIGKKFKDKLAK
jgi:hypothetical protein